MTLQQCEEKAWEEGFNSMEFIALFPSGPRNCKWLDAYYGLFKIDGIEGFVRAKDIGKQIPDLECLPLTGG